MESLKKIVDNQLEQPWPYKDINGHEQDAYDVLELLKNAAIRSTAYGLAEKLASAQWHLRQHIYEEQCRAHLKSQEDEG